VASLSRLEITIVEKRYPSVGDAPAHAALRDVRLQMQGDEFLCVIGPSGCGKTTLLNIVAGLDQDFEGRVDLPHIPGREAPAIGYVFQEPRLLPWRTAIENIELTLPPGAGDGRLVDELVEALGLEPFRRTYPERLSLGLSRRVALARAFAIRPDVMLLDEPFVSLDGPTAERLRRLLVRTWQDRPTAVIFVTHDVREAVYLADRIILLSPAPGAVIADIPIDLPRGERDDARALQSLRDSLIRQHPILDLGV
jgi:NitT/TauT family transport system ATP-binding protein